MHPNGTKILEILILNQPIRIAFAGSPKFAADIFNRIVDTLQISSLEVEYVGVLTQPDRRSGRRGQTTASEVGKWAEQKNIPVHKPERIADAAELKPLGPIDVMLLVAYGNMIPASALNVPRWGWWNIHPSALPQYRGASPLATAIKKGDKTTRCSLMLLEESMDTGPLLAQSEVGISVDWCTPDLENAMIAPAADLFCQSLDNAIHNKLHWHLQSDEGISYCGKIKKEDGHLDFFRPAVEFYNLYKAFTPWPGVSWLQDNERVKIRSCSLASHDTKASPGTILEHSGDSLIVACAPGSIALEMVQRPGKSPVSAKAWFAGARIENKAVLGGQPQDQKGMNGNKI